MFGESSQKRQKTDQPGKYSRDRSASKVIDYEGALACTNRGYLGLDVHFGTEFAD
jgi:hypothetical protein